MKRSMASGGEKLKKIKVETEDEKPQLPPVDDEIDRHGTGFVNLDENLLYEILKHVDARSLAMASCVSNLWNRTALDERLWELICTGHWSQVGGGTQQLRSVVLALGGFRRLHSLYLWPLSKPPPKNGTARWGKDQVQLSLCLLSIRYFEKMNFPVKDK